MLHLVLAAVIAADPRWRYLPPFDPPPRPWPVALDLHQPRTRPPRPFPAAQARTWHGIHRPHGFERVELTVTLRR